MAAIVEKLVVKEPVVAPLPVPAIQPSPVVEKPVEVSKPSPPQTGLKRKHETETVAVKQEDALVSHLKNMAPEPLDSSLETQAFHRLVRPDLSGFFDLIEIAIKRIHTSFGYLRRPCTAGNNDSSDAWLSSLRWACLREFLLIVERYENQFTAPRTPPTHNRLLLPLDVSYAIQCMRPLVSSDSPTLILDYAHAFGEVMKRYPTFQRQDSVKTEEHQTIVVFLQSKRLTTLSLINPDWELSLLGTGIVEENGLRAYICKEKLTHINMLFALQLNFFRCRSVNGVVFIPILNGSNAIMAPHLTSHRRGDFFDSAMVWMERVSSVLAMQSKS